jgi:hypothetical protein
MATIAKKKGKIIIKDGKVSCACCGCDPNAQLWGPGYDNRPSSIEVWGQTLPRVYSCFYMLRGVTLSLRPNAGVIWDATTGGLLLSAASLFSTGGTSGVLNFSTFPSSQYSVLSEFPAYQPLMLNAYYYRQNLPGPKFPYGTYALQEDLGGGYAVAPATITISPP